MKLFMHTLIYNFVCIYVSNHFTYKGYVGIDDSAFYNL